MVATPIVDWSCPSYARLLLPPYYRGGPAPPPLSISNPRPALSNFFSSLLCVVGYFVPLDLFTTGRRGCVSLPLLPTSPLSLEESVLT